MENNYPNWSIVEYFQGAMSFVGYGVSQPGDFWVKLGALFFCILLSAGFIPLSILWFIIKNQGRVGRLTWALLIATPIIGFVWMALA